MAEFGEQLKKAREAKGMTQQSLANLLYVTRQSISRWESGSRYPDLLMLKEISKILEVSTDELLSNEETPKIIDKSHVIENSISKNIQIALYSIIVFLLMMQAFNQLRAPNVIDDLTSFHFYSIFLALKELLEAILFIYYFITLIKGMDTPKTIGKVIIGIFTLEFLSRIHLLINAPSIFTAIIGLIPHLIGMIGAYLFYYTINHQKLNYGCICIGFLYGIYIECWKLFNITLYANQYFSYILFLSSLLMIMIYISFIYSSYIVLNKKKVMINFVKWMSE